MRAEQQLAASVDYVRELTKLTNEAYAFANSMQTNMRRVPIAGAIDGQPANYHWRHVLPVYEAELADFKKHVAAVRAGVTSNVGDEEKLSLEAVPLRVLSPGAESYTVQVGSRVFTDRTVELQSLDPALHGLTGIRFSDKVARVGYQPVEIEVARPVRVLIGYVRSTEAGWRRPPELETDALAGERGGTEPLRRNAATVDTLPPIDVHAFDYAAGRQRIMPRGTGSFIILGIVAAAPSPAPGVAPRPTAEERPLAH